VSAAWPPPKGGYKRTWRIGRPLTDREIRQLGYEPTRDGWTPIPERKVVAP
jgi:hypothetical protein